MSNHHQALMGGADAQQDFLAGQVELFLFDLKNEASEHGFKPGESWILTLATEDEMTSLKKAYHPIISIRLQPKNLLQAFQQVKSKLQQSLSKDDIALTVSDLDRDEKKHLAAYPARDIRK